MRAACADGARQAIGGTCRACALDQLIARRLAPVAPLGRIRTRISLAHFVHAYNSLTYTLNFSSKEESVYHDIIHHFWLLFLIIYRFFFVAAFYVHYLYVDLVHNQKCTSHVFLK